MAEPLLYRYWAEKAESLLTSLGSSSQGLTSADARKKLAEVGANTLAEKQKTSAFSLFLNQFKSPIVLILLFATLVSAFMRDWVDSVIIFAIVLGSALLSFIQEFNASNAAERLKTRVSLRCDVVRDGKIVSVLTEEIIPGDVVHLSAGSLIPADGVVLEARDFFVDQAVLTGETFPVEKKAGEVPETAGLSERSNVVYKGTNVRSGSARVLIVATGHQTAIGQIAHRLVLRPPENEFERGIRRLGYLLSEVMFLLVIGILVFNIFFHKPLLDSLLFSIALAVGLTPQLLPAIININLSKGSQAMAERGVIVRRLVAIENFGSMDVLCTDKTGTLTQGVVKLDGALDVQGNPSDQVLLYAYLNASLQTGLENPIDAAIQTQQVAGADQYKKVDEIPYDFTRKRLSVVVESPDQPCLMIVKGALENVLGVCSHSRLEGKDTPLTDDVKAAIEQRYQDWSGQGYRVVGVAVRLICKQHEPYTRADEADLTFIGFLLFFDPPKEDVLQAVQALEKLGVRLKIITGDNHLVAAHIGNLIGLKDPVVMTGSQMDEMRDEALWHAVENTTIFAEVDPNQKERIILALKKRGYVVGYMGDGINDAPSLHSADVGISVDNAVDVAKDAADFVLLRQDLDVLREGILQGRKTFANTLKYVFMATSANFGNMFSVAGASLFLPYLPMLPKQILLINFLTDLPEMTIASDRVDDVMVERPHRWNIHFISRFMLVFGLISSFFDFATFAVLLWLIKANEMTFHTGWFIESVISAAVVVFVMRTRLPFFRSRPSRPMLLMTGLVALITLALPYTPLAGLMGFTPIPLVYLLFIFAIIGLYVLTAEIAKRWFYRRYSD